MIRGMDIKMPQELVGKVIPAPTKKHWDIKRSSREKWSAADWHMHRFIIGLKSRGWIDEGMRAYLIIYNPAHPSRSQILMEVL